MALVKTQDVGMREDGSVICVLAVEDDLDDLYLLNRMLESDTRRQYHVEHAATLAQAIEILDTFPIDIILLDLGLSDSQGMETLVLLIKQVSDTPIVVFTGANDESIGEEAVRAGAEDFIPKGEANATLLSRSIAYAIDRHRLLLKIQDQASRDPLTGLPNRTALYERLEIIVNSVDRHDANLAVILMDLDEFKDINDTYGHRVGDDLLRQVSARLQKSLRKTDMAARLGGDEFVLVLTNFATEDELWRVVEKKREQLLEPLTLLTKQGLKEFAIGISMGVATWSTPLTPQALLSAADDAMYTSKRNGKNTVHYASQAELRQ